jgi:predicted ATPase
MGLPMPVIKQTWQPLIKKAERIDELMANQDKSRRSRQPKQAAQAKKIAQSRKKASSQKMLQSSKKQKGITSITIEGFKSISQKQSIEIRPLTILAGANSSGKSSIMQPLLLLKQTLNASYDPGPLMLNGPNIKFTAADQLLSNIGGKHSNTFSIGVIVDDDTELTIYFTKGEGTAFAIEQMTYRFDDKVYRLYEGMESDELLSELTPSFQQSFRKLEVWLIKLLEYLDQNTTEPHIHFTVTRNRCFLTITLSISPELSGQDIAKFATPLSLDALVGEYISQIIHLPGLRGTPERNYPISAVGSNFPGTFENYSASIIRQWQISNAKDKLEHLNSDLIRLGLTRNVTAVPTNDTQVELRVTRFLSSKEGTTEDTVSIADVGLGISQTLPVLVALHAANSKQLIYLEQPEIHLHPRAQYIMADVLADAVLQGKRLVVETHSSLLILAIQTLVAEGKLPPDLVKLHWFQQQEDGSTQITSTDLDQTGAFGDWPEDFAAVALDSESRYLDAAQARLLEGGE